MTRKFTFLLMALLALAGFKSWGQESQTITIGTGTSTLDDMPFNSFFNYSYAQMLYLGSEIGESGTITSISFYAQGSVNAYLKLDIYMKCVDRDSYSNTSDWESVSAENLVYHNESYLATSTGWITFNLVEPFQYDKSKNLMIAFDNNTGSYFSSKQFRYTNTSGNTCIYRSDDNNNVDPMSPAEGNPAVWRPNIQITIEPSVSCPAPTGLAASNITATGATISWTDNGAESYNLDVNGTVYENVTNPYILDVELSTTYTVKVQAVCGENETSAWSSGINFTTPDCWDGHTINYTLTDSYGDGWNGANLTIVDKSNNNTIKTLTLSGSTESGSLTLCSGTYDFVWHKGQYDYECSFSISENEETLFTCGDASVYNNTLDLLEKFSITFTQPSEEIGTISADLEEATAGTTVTLSANFNLGYTLDYFMVNGVQIEGNTFEMPEHDVTVSVAYNTLTMYDIHYAEITGGTVWALCEEHEVTEAPAGYTVNLIIEPYAGHVLDYVTINNEPIEGTSFVMPAQEVTVGVIFKDAYAIYNGSPMGGSISFQSIPPSAIGETYFPEGTQIVLSAEAEEGYVFVEQSFVVTREDNEETVPVNYSSGFPIFVMPASDVTVTATFNAIPYYNVTKDVNPMYSGYYDVSKTSHIAENEQIAISNINPATGYEFGSVVVTRDDNGNAVETSLYQGSYYFDMPNSDVTVTVNFNALPLYSVYVGEVVNGTITVDEPYEDILAGTQVYLSATPATNYVLERITVTPEDGNPFEPTQQSWYYYFTMPSSNVTISATFRQLQTYTINYFVNGELDRTMQCREDGLVNNDGPQNVAVPAGTTFEGWGVAEIGTYTTEKPAVLGNAESPTQNYDLYAVLSYTESVPASSKSGETWKKVTSTSELSAGDEIVLVYGNYVMGEKYSYNSDYYIYEVNIINDEISSLPSSANILTLVSSGSNWKLQYYESEISSTTTLSYNSGCSGLAYYGMWSGYTGYDSYDEWTAVESSGVMFCNNAYSSKYIGKYADGDYITAVSSSTACKVFKKDNPVITTNYYMTSVLTNGEVTENTTAKNIIISNYNSINVKNGATLTMDANGLFRNGNEINGFVFEDGTQFYYTGEESVNAIFKKEINGYTGENDNYYLIANPTDNNYVGNLDYYYTHDLYTFDPEEALEWQNHHDDIIPYVERGIGYLYANSEDITLQFSGNLMPAGTTALTLVKAEEGEGIDFPGFNLIGNPFACNAYVEGYNFYRMTGGELQAAGTSATVAPCEGFFVEARANGDKVTLSTTAPEATANMMSLSVNQNRGNVIDRAIVRFDGANDLHKFMLNPQRTNIRLAKNGEEFAAISSENEGEIPVSFKAEKNGSYTITVNTENVEANYLHLIDNLTGMDTDLLSTPSYTFNASTSDYAYRFKLVFSMTDVEENESNANSFAYISNGNLVINNIEGEATMQIVDVLGRVVSTEIVSGSYNKALNLKAGLYIINLNGMTQKIVVK